MIPQWFTLLSAVGLIVGAMCSVVIIADLMITHGQQMWIMNIVWPLSALFGTVFVLLAYYCYGRLASRNDFDAAKAHKRAPPSKLLTPFPATVLKATLHCGSGCTLGDIFAEFLAYFFPVVAIWLGWQSLFSTSDTGKMFAVWILDFVFAFGIGIIFQYFTIVPMRNLSAGEGIVAAIKADALSLLAWQIGMYGLMAAVQFLVVARMWNTWLMPNTPGFWFVMQLAMLAGFATSYPVNWILVRNGLKERM